MNENERGVADWLKKALASSGIGLDFVVREIATDIREMLLKLLSNATLEVHAKIRIIPSKDGHGLSIKLHHDDVMPAKKARTRKKKTVSRS